MTGTTPLLSVFYSDTSIVLRTRGGDRQEWQCTEVTTPEPQR